MFFAAVYAATGCNRHQHDPVILNGIQVGDKKYVGVELCYKASAEGADSYMWDLGDGTTSTDPAPCHIYTAAGTYMVKLMLNNSPELTAYAPVTIKEAPKYTALTAGTHNFTYYFGRSFSSGVNDTLHTADTSLTIGYIDPVTLNIGGDTLICLSVAPGSDSVTYFYKTILNSTGHNTSNTLVYVHGAVRDSLAYFIRNQQSPGGAVIHTYISR